jgi:probable F420-dependent oxidoreductase
MKFTAQIPVGDITPGEFQTTAAIKEMADALEAAKIDACYVTDHPAPSAAWLHAHGHDALESFTALAFIAAATTSLKLHTNVLVLPYRNPFLTAKAAATLQVLSGGRLILGTGAGYQVGEFEALGVDFHKRGALFNEALEAIRLAWAGGSVVMRGINFNAAGNEPRPIPDMPPPIWIGGGSGKAVERAARWGDGWCPFFAAPTMSKSNQESGIHSIEQLRDKIVQLQEMRAAQGKRGHFDVAIGVHEKLEFGSAESADRYLEGVAVLAAVGVTWIMVDPPHPSRKAYLENVHWFGESVISRLQAKAITQS